MTAWPFPWPKPRSVYEDDGPAEATELDFAGARFRISPTAHEGIHTGRTRFKVECLTCGEVIHDRTTGGSSRVMQHADERHGWRRS